MPCGAGNSNEEIGQEKIIDAPQIGGVSIKRVSQKAFNLL